MHNCYRNYCIIVTESAALLLPKTLHFHLPKLLHSQLPLPPTIGLLICRQKDSMLAQYALEGSNLPLGISEYELSKLYPEKVEGTMPTIEEIETRLENVNSDKQ
jgi:hypothetical protein